MTGFDLSAQDSNVAYGSRLSPAYTEAVNAARFVKGFGIAALIFSLQLFLGSNLLGAGCGIGIGLFILRYDKQTYYRALGITVMVVALLLPIAFFSPLILSCAVLWKGIMTLQTLAREGKEDDDWAVSRKRVLIGTICSGIGIAAGVLFILLVVALVGMAVLRGVAAR